ncbi:MAG: RluA family pseudouridine synthase [Bacteroidetes bacterium]|nr:RluA family pseudouridine synthase [Bacteroidota bacterium]
MQLLESHTVPPGTAPTRLSDYLAGKLAAIPSRKGVKKAIKRGAVQVEGKVATTAHWVKPGERITLYDLQPTPPKPFPLDIPIIYEDDYFAVVDKPAGLPVSGNQYRTLVNALVGQAAPSPLPDALPWAMPVHRLDAPTSGLVAVAKCRSAQLALGQAFEAREVKKTYLALVGGATPAQGQIEEPLDGKPACTRFEKIEAQPSRYCGTITLLRLYPHTGRTHQLRRHLAGEGFPILGDRLYTPEGQPLLRKKGLMLCAVKLELPHPKDGKTIEVETAPPSKFARLMERQ